MSADNLVAIQKIGDWYYVWHESASNECPMPSLNTFKTLNKQTAMLYAQELHDDCLIVEYGIHHLTDVDDPILWFADILGKQTEWIFDMLIEIRNLANQIKEEDCDG